MRLLIVVAAASLALAATAAGVAGAVPGFCAPTRIAGKNWVVSTTGGVSCSSAHAVVRRLAGAKVPLSRSFDLKKYRLNGQWAQCVTTALPGTKPALIVCRKRSKQVAGFSAAVAG